MTSHRGSVRGAWDVETDTIPSRPYSRMKSEPSVTTIIGELNKPGLEWGASKEAAKFAVYGHDEWFGLEDPAAVELIRKHFKGVWDGRAAMGTLVHTVNECWINGESPDLEILVKAVPSWQNQIPEKIEEADRYVAGLAKFWNDWEPTEFRSEDVVRSPGQYIGTRDLFGRLRGDTYVLDLKTTAEQNAEKGIYGPEWSLQLAAYNHAKRSLPMPATTRARFVSVKLPLTNGPSVQGLCICVATGSTRFTRWTPVPTSTTRSYSYSTYIYGGSLVQHQSL